MGKSMPNSPSLRGISADTFRRVAGTFATGVAVVTTMLKDDPHGCTANAVTSLSLDPPLMIVCLAHSSSTRDVVIKNSFLAINILDQTVISRNLCKKFASQSLDKFLDVEFRFGELNVPILATAMSWLECEVIESHESTDHTIFIAQVLHADDSERMPLLYFRGRFGSLSIDAT